MDHLAGAAGTVLAPSGKAAIAVALMSALSAGDHLLMTDSAYDPTRAFCNGTLKRMGVETTYYDPRLGAGIADLFRPNTKAVFVELPGSLSLEVQDLPAIAEVAHGRGACVIADNTWATPLLFSRTRPWRRSGDRDRGRSISPAIPISCSASFQPTPSG